MKNKILFIVIIVTVLWSCTNGKETNNPYSLNNENELFERIKGEWAVGNSWTEKILVFNNIEDEKFKQEIFPTFNTIIFNKENKTIEQKSYGEFGCGTAALDNLEIRNSKWSFKDGLLHLNFEYIDYSGKHSLQNFYTVDREEQKLTLTKIK